MHAKRGHSANPHQHDAAPSTGIKLAQAPNYSSQLLYFTRWHLKKNSPEGVCGTRPKLWRIPIVRLAMILQKYAYATHNTRFATSKFLEAIFSQYTEENQTQEKKKSSAAVRKQRQNLPYQHCTMEQCINLHKNCERFQGNNRCIVKVKESMNFLICNQATTTRNRQ